MSANPKKEIDPAWRAANKEKERAFEWLRSVSLSATPEAHHAAVLMYELYRLKYEHQD